MKPEFKTLLKSCVAKKCGRCNQGNLFTSYLKFDSHCPVCNLDYNITDTADGPAFFVGFLAMIIFTPIFIIVAFLPISKLAVSIGYILASLACLVFCLTLLPLFKALLFNLQIHHRAGDCDFDYVGTHGTPTDNWKKYLKQTPTPSKNNQNTIL